VAEEADAATEEEEEADEGQGEVKSFNKSTFCFLLTSFLSVFSSALSSSFLMRYGPVLPNKSQTMHLKAPDECFRV
jgi:hypothetical protein